MSKIPRFANEQEEADFWATHDATEYLNETEAEYAVFVDARPPKKQISLRLENNKTHVVRVRVAVPDPPRATGAPAWRWFFRDTSFGTAAA